MSAALVAASGPSQSCTTSPPYGLGQVTVLTASLPSASPLPWTTNDILRIDCEGLPAVAVVLQVSAPPPGVRERGTIVFANGAYGASFFSAEANGLPLFQVLQAAGYRLVDQAWAPSWFANAASVRKQSCRFATVLQWVHDHCHATGTFGAVGSSSGAGAIGYALTTWGSGDILDLAVCCGGPPMSRLDWQCPDPPPAAWLSQCAAIVPPHVLACGQPACYVVGGVAANAICSACSANPSPAELWQDSILHPGAAVSWPRTRVHVLLGDQDCSGAAPPGLFFFNAIACRKVIEFVPGTPHSVIATAEGRDAIAGAVVGGAANPSAATLAFQAWPRIGGTLDLVIDGAPSAAFVAALSTDAAMAEVAPFGWLLLLPPLFPAGSGQLEPLTGQATLSYAVAPSPSLVGLEVFGQALVGSGLTNRIRFQLLP